MASDSLQSARFSPRAWAIHSAFVIVAVGLGCATPYSADAPSPAGPDAAPAFDASADTGAIEGGAINNDSGSNTDVDAAIKAPSICSDFRQSDDGFTAENATRSNVGFSLNISGSQLSTIKKTFAATAPIVGSNVSVRLTTLEFGGSWSGGYINLAGLFLGPTTTLPPTSPAMLIDLKQFSLEINGWKGANSYDAAYSMVLSPLSIGALTVQATRKWPSGVLNMSVGSSTQTITMKGANAASTTFTVSIGGSSMAGAPTLKTVVESVCVTLETSN